MYRSLIRNPRTNKLAIGRGASPVGGRAQQLVLYALDEGEVGSIKGHALFLQEGPGELVVVESAASTEFERLWDSVLAYLEGDLDLDPVALTHRDSVEAMLARGKSSPMTPYMQSLASMGAALSNETFIPFEDAILMALAEL